MVEIEGLWMQASHSGFVDRGKFGRSAASAGGGDDGCNGAAKRRTKRHSPEADRAIATTVVVVLSARGEGQSMPNRCPPRKPQECWDYRSS